MSRWTRQYAAAIDPSTAALSQFVRDLFDRHLGTGGRPGSIHDGVGESCLLLLPPAYSACMHAFPLQLLACCGTQMQAAAQLAAACRART